jgi:hypothetical protein
MGALEKYLDQLPDTFDASQLLDPDVEKFEGTVYTSPLIYKYYSPARRSFFERPQVRFSQREALNDPFEMSRRWNEISADGLRRHVSERLQSTLPKLFLNNNYLIDSLKEHFESEGNALSSAQEIQLSHFLKSDAGKSLISRQLTAAQALMIPAVDYVFSRIETEFQQLVDNVVSKFGILSLTEDPLSQLMWAHYASRGAGFVIGFDAHNSFFLSEDISDRKSLLRKVAYTDERIENFWRNPYYLFLVKSADWAYEREWRMLKDLSDCDERRVLNGEAICLCNLPPEVIKTVYFGYEYETSQIERDLLEVTRCGCTPEFYSTKVNRSTGLLEPQPIAR